MRIKQIILKAMGQAISKFVFVAEIVMVVLLLALYCCNFG
jgi:DNA-binding protein